MRRRLVGRAPRRNVSRPANDERHAQAAFVEHALAAAQREVVGDAARQDARGLIPADAAVVAAALKTTAASLKQDRAYR